VARALILRPFAKINLRLRVGGVRADGFHDVDTVLQALALTDRLVLSAQDGPFTLTVDSSDVPADRTNLVWRAAQAVWQAAGRTGEAAGVRARLSKVIPSAAGLGGGSADAAAALVGLNVLWRARLARADLSALGATLGADVPFFLHGGTALGLDRGDEIYPLDDIARHDVIIIKPAFGVATPDAYRWLDEDRGRAVAKRVPVVRRAVDVGWAGSRLVVGNDLEAPVSRRHRAIAEIVGDCLAAGARVAGMTGSGSAVFGLFRGVSMERVARRLRRSDALVLVTRTLKRREALGRLGL
jgi:4-diphosphocytidyl-2-C-methyl-D-erythritol kinase